MNETQEVTEMGAAAHLVATALEGIIAQRLVRRLCPECKEVYKPTDKELKYIKKWVPEFQEFSYPQPIVVHEVARKRVLETYAAALKPA